MKILRITVLVAMLAGLAIGQSRDMFTVAESDHTISMFVACARMSGMAKTLREDGPLTVFAVSDRAFANLAKQDMEALLANPSAMHALLGHYIVRGSIPADNTTELASARTLMGVKLRAGIRSEGIYVNGARLNHPEIRCTNGTIYVLDSFDPGLVHDALALVKPSRRAQ